MKQLMVYVHPTRQFNGCDEALARVQVDNSLQLGWQPEDIVLAMNFPFSYRGVESLDIGDEVFCQHNPISTKLPTVIKMFDMGLIQEDETYWLHDLDAYQLVPFSKWEPWFSGDMALCDYGRRPKWEGGNIFFRHPARDIFVRQRSVMEQDQSVDENALTKLCDGDAAIAERITRLNISYSFKPFNVRSCYPMAIKPIRIAHFHPLEDRRRLGIPRLLDFYKGYNKIRQQLIPDRLVKVFWENGIV